MRQRRPKGGERERREAQARALLLKRQRLVLRAAAGLRRSDEFRALVAAIEGSAAAQDLDADLLALWIGWVLEQADRVDMRVRSAVEIEKWVGEFGLEDRSPP